MPPSTPPRTATRIDGSAVSVDRALRPGRGDPLTVLSLWCLRRTFTPLLFGGLIAATISGSYHSDALGALTSPGEILGAIFSPLAGVALALVVRVAVGALAFLTAGALSVGSVRAADGAPLVGRWRVWSDRARVTRAYRALRWTWAVRAAALARSGAAGRWLELVDRALMVLGVLLAVGWVVVVVSVDPISA